MDADALIAQLCEHRHISRAKALETLEGVIAARLGEQGDSANFDDVVALIDALLGGDTWEGVQSGFLAAKLAVPVVKTDAFVYKLVAACDAQLENKEPRVRLATGECMHALCSAHGTRIYEALSERVLKSIHSNFHRDSGEEEPKEDPAGDFLGALLDSAYQPKQTGQGELRHDTEGWKCLETSFKALQKLMDGCGQAFFPHLTEDVRGLVYEALAHDNRFVRETGFFTLKAVCDVTRGEDMRSIGDEVAKHLASGLADNWSQVRFAASVATRSFMEGTGGLEGFSSDYFPALIPFMCLNRYYVAEGVRVYSQETWRRVMGDQGRHWVAKCAKEVADVYVRQSGANNHAVREAACACIAELMAKVDVAAVAPHVPKLLKALIYCFKDESWPVRDAACIACGKCVLSFPEESRTILDELYELWFAHLWDNIASVRSNTAAALANAARAYGDEALDKILPRVREMLPLAKQQPNEAGRYGGLSNTTQFGVAQRVQRDNDEELHTDQTMFSCGSLAPKLKASDGCMDHGFSRDKEPWEASDGCIYMVRELASIAPEKVAEFLPAMAELGYQRHFAHFHNLQETLWKQLPFVAQGMGKKAFKPHLEPFIQPMFEVLACGEQHAESAAGYAISEIAAMIGPRIFEGRLDDQQKAAMASSPHVILGPAGGMGPGPGAMGGAGAHGGAGPGGMPMGDGVAPWAKGGAGAVPAGAAPWGTSAGGGSPGLRPS